MPPAPKRRWFRYRLGAVLTLASLLIAGVGSWAVRMHAQRSDLSSRSSLGLEERPAESWAHWTRMRLGWRQYQDAIDTANMGLARFP
jgi:hypothetical protein